MAALTLAEILNDVRLIYDINKDEKAAKLAVHLRDVIDDITTQVPGALTTVATTLTTATGGVVTFPSDMEVVYGMFYGTQEIKPLDPFTYIKFQQQSSTSSNLCCLLSTTSAGLLVGTIPSLGSGASVSIIYKRRIDDVTKIPLLFKYIVLDGMKWHYECYELLLNETRWIISFNKYNERLNDLAVRMSNQDNMHMKCMYQDEWTGVLMRI